VCCNTGTIGSVTVISSWLFSVRKVANPRPDSFLI
jgi:hypothetical protein